MDSRVRILNLRKRLAFLKTLKFWEFAAVLAAAIFAGKQLFDTRGQIETLTQIATFQGQLLQKTSDATSEELTMSLDDRLSDPINTSIFQAMENNKKLRQKNGGPFSDGTLDSFLAVYENLNDAYNARLITKNNLCNMFSDGLFTAAQSNELNAYIAEVQKGSSQYDTGYQNMVAITSKICN